ncbi:MAG: arginine N-succinyltransferase [Pseudomonadota bacterium]
MSNPNDPKAPETEPAATSETAAPAPTSAPAEAEAEAKRRFSGLQVLGISLLVMVLTVGITTFVVWRYVFPSQFKPVALNEREQATLEQKINRLGLTGAVETGAEPEAAAEAERLEPQAYSEAGASREVSFSERELNALLASNTQMAQRLAFDLSEDLASARLLVPLDPDFPVLGGKTLRVNAGLEVAFRNGQPVAILRGVSLMGVPLPNAWLGNLKNVDLVQEFGGDPGFWQALAAGIEHLEVRDGRLALKLKE